MRILASNPDTLGDLILRQPLYASLQAAGHELTLIVRPAAVPLVKFIAPGARVIELHCEPYADDFETHHRETCDDTFRAAAEVDPELLLIAPYRWTRFDERLAEALPAVRRAGMSGHLYGGNPYAGYTAPSSLTFQLLASVDCDDREIQKNAALARLITGAEPSNIDPRLTIDREGRSRAEEILDTLGLAPGTFWIACVSGTAHVSLKAWPVERWSELLREWSGTTGRTFLFVGTADELDSATAVRSAMGEVGASHTRVWMPAAGTIEELIGLTELSGGYVGHDTGPMHVAAALSKPVLGVFGGGHGMRFAPAVDPSVAIVVGVPCMNCAWICPFSTSHCVKQIPPAEVLRAAFDLEDRRIVRREVRMLEPGAALLSQMVDEAADAARRQTREAGERAKLLATSDAARQSEVSSQRTRAQTAEDDATALRAQLKAAADEAMTARAEADRASAELAIAASELENARAEITRRIAESEASAARLRDHVSSIERLDARAVAIIERRMDDHGRGVGVSLPDPDPIVALRAKVDRIGTELESFRPKYRYRRPLKHFLVEWLIGRKDYPVRPPRPLPRITIVLPTLNAAVHLRETLDSVVSQNYNNVEFIVVDGNSTDGTAQLLDEYRPHIGLLISEPDKGPMHAAAKGLEHATGEVLHLLFAGDCLEPGALLRIAEHFARSRGVNAMTFEDSVTYPNGWRFVPNRRRPLDVTMLLESGTPVRDGIFFRRSAYERLGKLNLSLNRAADWDFYLRLDRRFGIFRQRGQVRSIRPAAAHSEGVAAFRRDLPAARQAFLASFGAIGRSRCGMIHLFSRLTARLDAARDRFFFSFDAESKPLPPAEAPPAAPNQPICPLSGRHPDRFLFSTRDNNGGDRGIHYVYYDSASGAAVTYPPMSAGQLDRLYASQSSPGPRPVVPPDERCASPFRNFRGSRLGEFFMKTISPYWLIRKPNFGLTAADTLLEVISDDVPPNSSSTRVLNVGCFEGAVLATLKSRTRWQLFGTETNAEAAAAARAKGFTVWETPPLNAPLAIPIGEQFDIIFLDGQLEHFQDPVLILGRLRQLLLPGGKLVVNAPNLDSKHVDIFGPTWLHWQPPFHRLLIGRRALREMAVLTGLRVTRMKTITHPYRTCVSVQLRDLGLGAVVPTDAKFPDDVAVRGINLTGWSKLLYDWRGRGDYLYAVLEMP